MIPIKTLLIIFVYGLVGGAGVMLGLYLGFEMAMNGWLR